MRQLLLLIAISAAAAFSADFEVASVKPNGNSTGEPYDVQVVPDACECATPLSAV
jgi:hypothetical protein